MDGDYVDDAYDVEKAGKDDYEARKNFSEDSSPTYQKESEQIQKCNIDALEGMLSD
jgi:hypothetical protein